MSDIALYSRVDRVPVAAVRKTGSILLPSKVEPFIHHYECLEYNAVALIPHLKKKKEEVKTQLQHIRVWSVLCVWLIY